MILRRVGQGLLSIAILFTFVFFAIRTVPGDPAILLAGPSASPADVANIRHALGLDRPLVIQYLQFLNNVVHGDLGTSIVTRVPVVTVIQQRLPATLLLVAAGIAVASLAGLGGGLLAAARRNTIVDGATTTVAVALTSIPAFWFAIVLVDLFSVRLHLLPSAGIGSVAHLVLPTVVLAATQIGLVLRVARSSLLDVITADYVRVAHSKGLSGTRVWVVHILRNSLIPFVTIVGLQAGVLLGATVITETVFDWPGLGQLLIHSVQNRDYPVIQALTLVFGVGFVAINLLVDLMNSYIDPQQRRRA